MADIEVVYEDESVAVIYKPCGVLSEEDPDKPSAPVILRELIGGDVHTVHRLDRTTEGLMVYAKSKRAAAALSRSIQDNRLTKIYLAAVEGLTDDIGELSDLLFYDRSRCKSYVVRRERRGVKSARLSYERIGTAVIDGAQASLVRIMLHTGRTHQIRVQFASRNHPLIGDRRYGSCIEARQIALCACELAFPHPVTGEDMSFVCRPKGEVFSAFDNNI